MPRKTLREVLLSLEQRGVISGGLGHTSMCLALAPGANCLEHNLQLGFALFPSEHLHTFTSFLG